MLKYLEKIIKFFTNILLVIVVIAVFFALYNFVQLNFIGKKYVNFFNYTLFNVVSGSMMDTINIDDVIIVKITNDVKVDDIITYKSGDEFITHRIIKMEDDYVITKGDANQTPDNPIDKGIILGKVVKILPQYGVWQKVLMTPKVLVSIIVTMVLFSLAFSFKIKKPIEKKTENLVQQISIPESYNENRRLEEQKLDKKEEIKDEEDIEIL